MSSQCYKQCHNFYYNCVDLAGVLSDRPYEIIDCRKDKYKLRCPSLCAACSECDFVTTEELESELTDVSDKLLDLQDKIPKLEGQIFDLEDQLEELGSKVEDQIQDLLDKMKYSETPVTSAPQPTTYGKGSLELLEATADYQRSGYSYPKEALLDGVLETNQDKKAASGSGYGGYCYASSQSVASSG